MGIIKKNSSQESIKVSIINSQKKIFLNPAITRKIKRAVRKTCISERKTGNYEITVCFVSDHRIKELNQLYLRKGVPTDVLAFDITMADGRYSKTIFADIVISTDTVISNAKVFKTAPSYEVLLYVIHGVLHILGCDDRTKKKRAIMRKKELSILNKL